MELEFHSVGNFPWHCQNRTLRSHRSWSSMKRKCQSKSNKHSDCRVNVVCMVRANECLTGFRWGGSLWVPRSWNHAPRGTGPRTWGSQWTPTSFQSSIHGPWSTSISGHAHLTKMNNISRRRSGRCVTEVNGQSCLIKEHLAEFCSKLESQLLRLTRFNCALSQPATKNSTFAHSGFVNWEPQTVRPEVVNSRSLLFNLTYFKTFVTEKSNQPIGRQEFV